MPSNIIKCTKFQFRVQVQPKSSLVLFESLSYEVSQCSGRNQVDSSSSKEQAKVNYQTTTSLYRVKPHV